MLCTFFLHFSHFKITLDPEHDKCTEKVLDDIHRIQNEKKNLIKKVRYIMKTATFFFRHTKIFQEFEEMVMKELMENGKKSFFSFYQLDKFADIPIRFIEQYLKSSKKADNQFVSNFKNLLKFFDREASQAAMKSGGHFLRAYKKILDADIFRENAYKKLVIYFE
jgi:hypothetical protein